MKGAVVEAHLHVDHGVAGDVSPRHRLDDALLHGGDELARDGAADYGVLELEARAAGQRGELYSRVAELAAAAGLLFVAALGLGRARDRLHKRHLRRPRLDLDPVAVLDALQREFDVHLGEAGEDVFAGSLRALQVERGVLVDDAPYGFEDL